MSTTETFNLTGRQRQNREIEDLGQTLCQLSNEITRLYENDGDEWELCVSIQQYWIDYRLYQELCDEAEEWFHIPQESYPFYRNPHLSVLQAEG